MDAWELGAVVAVTTYNLAVLAGCAWLVQAFGWSPWWFVLALACMKSIKTGKAAENSND
jgi:hypothetical protein